MKVKTFGVAWNPEIPHSGDNKCLECDDGTLGADQDFVIKWRRHIVGFDSGINAAIFKCPKCHNLFWFHINPYIQKYFFEGIEID